MGYRITILLVYWRIPAWGKGFVIRLHNYKNCIMDCISAGYKPNIAQETYYGGKYYSMVIKEDHSTGDQYRPPDNCSFQTI